MPFRPTPDGKLVNGVASAVGAFVLTDIDGTVITVGATQRLVIYAITTDITGTATVGFASTPLSGVGNIQWGVLLPRGATPTVVALTTSTKVFIQAEILAS